MQLPYSALRAAVQLPHESGPYLLLPQALVDVGFKLATIPLESLRPYGVRLLALLVTLFGDVPDPLLHGASEQTLLAKASPALVLLLLQSARHRRALLFLCLPSWTYPTCTCTAHGATYECELLPTACGCPLVSPPGARLMEQYQAQVVSALRSSLGARHPTAAAAAGAVGGVPPSASAANLVPLGAGPGAAGAGAGVPALGISATAAATAAQHPLLQIAGGLLATTFLESGLAAGGASCGDGAAGGDNGAGPSGIP